MEIACINNLLDSLAIVEEEHKQLRDRVAICDKKVNDLYHVLELIPLDAVGLIKVAVELKETLKERRELKNKQRYHNSVLDVIQPKSLKKRFTKLSEKLDNDMEKWKKQSEESLKNLEFNK